MFCVFKSKLEINHAAIYIALFLPDSNNCFFVCLVSYTHICFNYYVLTTTHSTIYNFWFDFITSVSELESNPELNNPKQTIIPLENYFFENLLV